MSLWSSSELQSLFCARTPLVDVRAPVEFQAGHLPFSVNLPLMTDEEHRQVGICYKEQGQAKALELGHHFVRGDVKDQRVSAWASFIHQNPGAQVLCFRGGLRSQISCQWLRERGIERTPIPGGYKRLRQFLLSWLNDAPLAKLYRVAGFTGAGKTQLLLAFEDFLDLEALARHRGSAFGDLGPQPSQATFENALAQQLISRARLLVEDESLMLGKLRIPLRFYQALQASPLVWLEVPLEERIANVFRDYVMLRGRDFFLLGVTKLSRKLGGVRSQELRTQINWAFDRGLDLRDHAPWIEKLLTTYYDPAYEHSLRRQEGTIIHRGDAASVSAFLRRLT